jgi:signal-transduction protein with cAMP-binding, CBS, and nucleotidyltransferase domain
MILAELMRGKSHNVIKIKSSDCIADAATALTENNIGALLVYDDSGNIVGILSERDIVGGMGPHGADLHDVLVSELMTSDLIKCAPGDTVLEAMAMMTDRRIRHLPIYDGDNFVRFVSIGDLVKCRISEVQAEAEAMRQYISS